MEELLIAMIKAAADCKHAVNKTALVAAIGGDITTMKSSLINMSDSYCNMVEGMALLSGHDALGANITALRSAFTDYIAVADFTSEEEVNQIEDYFDILANAVTKMVA